MQSECRFSLRIGKVGCEHAYFGPGPARLLSLIAEGRSLNQAAAEMGMSYSKAWRIIREAESGLGYELLKSIKGGAGGGGSALTERALLLLDAYTLLDAALHAYAESLYQSRLKPIIGG